MGLRCWTATRSRTGRCCCDLGAKCSEMRRTCKAAGHLGLPLLTGADLLLIKVDPEALHLNNNLLGESLAATELTAKWPGIEGLTAAAADQTPRRLTGLFLNENQLAASP